MPFRSVSLEEVLRVASEPVAVEPTSDYPNLGIYSFARGVFEKPPISGSATSAKTLYRVKASQFIYSRLFAFEGAYSVVPQQLDGHFVSNEFPTFEADPEALDVNYLRWYFKQSAVWRSIAVGSKGMGDRRQRVHPEQVLAHKINLPSLEEQRRIVARLGRVSALVEERTRSLSDAEAGVDALLRKAFTHVIDSANYLPMGKVAPLVRRPVDVRPDESYPELGVRSFGRGTFHKPPLSGMDVGSKRLFRIEPGDLVFNVVFAWEGAVAIVQSEDEGRVGSHRFLTCVPDPGIASVDFLLYYFLTSEGLGKLGEASPGGAGRNRTLGFNKLAAIDVPVPPIERQRWFDAVQAKVRELRRTRAATGNDLEALIPAKLREVFASVIQPPRPQDLAGDVTARRILAVAS